LFKELMMGSWLLFTALTALAAEPQEDKETDQKKIQGTWTVVSLEIDGIRIPEEDLKKAKMKFVFKEDRLTQLAVDEKEKGPGAPFKLNPATKPKQLVVVERKDKRLGIYELDGNTLKICFPPDDSKEFPKELTGKGNVLYILNRDKP
jgi:uncharacterized protein (TIGR03067 family)